MALKSPFNLLVLFTYILRYHITKYLNITTYGPLFGYMSHCAIGDFIQEIQFDLNTALSVINAESESKFSSSIQISPEVVTYLGNSARHAKDTLSIVNCLTIPSFSFVFILRNPVEYKATMALGIGRTSFIAQLKDSNVIQSRRFSFFNESIFIDDFKKIYDDHGMSSKNSCKALSSIEPKWGCRLTGVLIGNYMFNTQSNPKNLVYYNHINFIQLNSIATFDTNEVFIVAPYRFHRFFMKYYFGHFIESEACIMKESESQIEFKCHEKAIEALHSINLVFGESIVILSTQDIFKGPFKSFAIVFRKNIKTEWILGKMITVDKSPIFDMDEKTIVFPLNHETAKINMKRIFGLRVTMLGSAICLSSLGIFVLIYTYVRIISESKNQR